MRTILIENATPTVVDRLKPVLVKAKEKAGLATIEFLTMMNLKMSTGGSSAPVICHYRHVLIDELTGYDARERNRVCSAFSG
jgi:hypothetical protein